MNSRNQCLLILLFCAATVHHAYSTALLPSAQQLQQQPQRGHGHLTSSQLGVQHVQLPGLIAVDNTSQVAVTLHLFVVRDHVHEQRDGQRGSAGGAFRGYAFAEGVSRCACCMVASWLCWALQVPHLAWDSYPENQARKGWQLPLPSCPASAMHTDVSCAHTGLQQLTHKHVQSSAILLVLMR